MHDEGPSSNVPHQLIKYSINLMWFRESRQGIVNSGNSEKVLSKENGDYSWVPSYLSIRVKREFFVVGWLSGKL